MKIYVAGSSAHPDYAANIEFMLRKLGHEIVSTWTTLDQQPQTPYDECILWGRCIEEIGEADLILIVALPNHTLKGAIFEAGLALGLGKEVAFYAPSAYTQVHHWAFAPGVHRCLTWRDITEVIRRCA